MLSEIGCAPNSEIPVSAILEKWAIPKNLKFRMKVPSRSGPRGKDPIPLYLPPSAIVGDEDGQEGDGTAGTEQHTETHLVCLRVAQQQLTTADYKQEQTASNPCSACANYFLALLLRALGITVYYTNCVRVSTKQLRKELKKFYAENFPARLGAPGAGWSRTGSLCRSLWTTAVQADTPCSQNAPQIAH